MKFRATILLLLGVIVFHINGITQDTIKMYLDDEFTSTEFENAKYIREVIIINNIYQVTDKKINGSMVNYGEYKSVNPWIEEGLSKHYDYLGKKYSEGSYINGNLTGKWIYYDHDNIDTVNYDIDLSTFQTLDCNKKRTNTNKRKFKNISKQYIDSITKFILAHFHLPARTKSQGNIFTQKINLTLDINGEIKCPDIVNFINKDLSTEFYRIMLLYKSQVELTNPLSLSISINSIDLENYLNVYTIVEDMPEFRYNKCSNTGECLTKFITDSIRIPNSQCSGRVFLNFVVEQDGSINSINILRSINNCDGYAEEIERLFKSMPSWLPGKQRGKAVRVRYNTAIDFRSLKYSRDSSLEYYQTSFDTIYQSYDVDVQPEYPGGVNEMMKFLGQTIRYPSDAIINNIQGKVYASFIVETNGSITNIKIVKGLNESCNQEVIRLIKLFPFFLPGQKDGVNVRVQYNLPVKFSRL